MLRSIYPFVPRTSTELSVTAQDDTSSAYRLRETDRKCHAEPACRLEVHRGRRLVEVLHLSLSKINSFWSIR